MYEMGGVAQQSLSLPEVLVDEPILLLLEVSQTPVDELRRLRRGSARPVATLDDRNAQATADRIERNTGAGDAAAYDEHVEILAAKSFDGELARVDELVRHGSVPVTAADQFAVSWE